MVARPLLAALALLALLAGCAPRRVLKISSVPPGATIRLDGEEVGETPLEMRFEHYGVRRITLYKDGYHTSSERVELDPPWWSRFPIDFVTEVALPFGWKDKRRYKVVLEAGTERMTTPSLRSVIQRADVLRNAGPEGPSELPATEPVPLPRDEDEPPEETEDDEEEP